MAVIRDGLPVVEVAIKFGMSRQSVHAWIRRYEVGGVTALEDRSHRPFVCPHQVPPAVEAELCELRRQHPAWGPARLPCVLAKREVDPVPSRSALHRALVRQRLIEPTRQRRRKDWVRWERHRPMELWQLDVLGGIFLADGTERKALTGIDDHSRFCVCAGLMERPRPGRCVGTSWTPCGSMACPTRSSRTTARCSPAATPPSRSRCSWIDLPPERDHPPSHRDPVSDHDGEDRHSPSWTENETPFRASTPPR
jgi:transposase